MPVFEAAKSHNDKWGVASPTVVTYIHRLSSPPGDEVYQSRFCKPYFLCLSGVFDLG